MRTKEEYISIICNHSEEIKSTFGVKSLRLFGSTSRNQHKEESDVDVFVEMPPKIFKIVGLGIYLEGLLGCHVDVVRNHSNLNEFLKREIENDGITIF